MKFNWGAGMAALYLSFAGGMSYLVYRCTRENIDLVTADYYAQEIRYDERYARLRNTAALEAPVRLAHDAAARSLTIEFPAAARERIEGTLYFYKPDDAALDFSVAIAADGGVQTVHTGHMAPGLWKVKAEWQAGGKGYYHEQSLLLK
jgi:hypothetical protein